MATKEFSDYSEELTAASALTGAEIIAVSQGGAARRTTAQDIADLGAGGGGATNLSYTASPTSGTVTSDTGTDATLTLADGTNAGLMAPAQHSKLAGIAAGATANATDAQLRDRTTHTGTQAASTISDFAATVRATVLTGLSTAATTVVAATHTVLEALGFLQGQITSHTGDTNNPHSVTAAQAGAVAVNASITGATKTKITYDSKGLVTGGADATTADIADSTNRRYMTDAQQTVLGNTSGTNTGDQTSVTGNAGTATALQTARTIDGQSFDGTASITVIAPGTHAAASKATPVDADELPLVDSAASNVLKRLTWANLKATLNAAVAGAIGSSGLTQSTGKLLGRSTASTGAVEEITVGSGLSLSAGTLTASGGSPGGSTTQVQYNNAGAFAGASGITTTGTELTIASGTKTASSPAIDVTQTWNSGAIAFSARKVTVTDTASASGSLLDNLQVGGVGKYQVTKAGGIRMAGGVSLTSPAPFVMRFANGSDIDQSENYPAADIGTVLKGSGRGVVVRGDAGYGLTNGSSSADSVDVLYGRNSAGVADITSGTSGAYRDLKLRNLISTAIVTKTASYTATAADHTILCDCTSGAITITLPAVASSDSLEYRIKKIDSSGNAVTIDGNASETIDGATTSSLAAQWNAKTIKCNGSGWYVTATV